MEISCTLGLRFNQALYKKKKINLVRIKKETDNFGLFFYQYDITITVEVKLDQSYDKLH